MNIQQIVTEQIVAENTLNKIWNNTQMNTVEKAIIKRHYAMDKSKGRRPQSFEHIAKALGLELPQVKDLHDSALTKMRFTAKEMNLSWKGKTL